MFRACCRWQSLACLTLLVSVGSLGCNKQSSVLIDPPPAFANLRRIGLAYKEAHDKLKRPPRSAEELKPHLAQFGDPDQTLISPNDGQPFVIIWDVTIQGKPGEDWTPPVLAYERSGKDGLRWVLRGYDLCSRLNDEEFAGAEFAKGHKPN